jgi:hypothetical protein
VWFNPALSITVGGQTWQGSNKNCTIDQGAVSIAELTFSTQFVGSLKLNAATNNLTITSAVSMANGLVEGAGKVKLANNTSFAWTGGMIKNE